MKRVHTFINVKSDLGVATDGAGLAPKIISDCFDLHFIEINKLDIKKDKTSGNKPKNLTIINELNKEIFDKTLQVLENNNFPIILGGDHSISIGSALASKKYHQDLGVIWIDAHGDYNTFKTSPSGNIHGFPLAAITGYENSELTSHLNTNLFDQKEAVIVGVRDLDEGEIINLNNSKCTAFTTNDIHNSSVLETLEKAFKIASNSNKHGIHISFDVDVIDPAFAPGVSVPVCNGISIDEAKEIFKYLHDHKDLIKSLDIVEYNPRFEINNKTLNIIKDLIKIFLD